MITLRILKAICAGLPSTHSAILGKIDRANLAEIFNFSARGSPANGLLLDDDSWAILEDSELGLRLNKFLNLFFIDLSFDGPGEEGIED